MNLAAESYTLALPRPFRIAHGVSLTRETILVTLRDGAWVGRGEGALPPYYPSKSVDCLAWLETISPDSLDLSRPLPPAPPEAAAARVALEIALQDLQAQKTGLPLWKTLHSGPSRVPPCPLTLSIPESEDDLRCMLDDAAAAGHHHLKLKSGSGDPAWDEACVRHVAARGFAFSVDANAGWPVADAVRLIGLLASLKVEFVEQPVARDIEAWRELRQGLENKTCPPLVADESIQSTEDIIHFRSLADGINVKLLKAGGISGALRWIEEIRRCQMKVMIGVMVETGIGRTAAAHLAPLADWLDIDPPANIPIAPYCGVQWDGDKLTLSDRPGLGFASVE